ncbi:MAG TPA: alpha/beta hydrolase [Rhodocyclaceae bacterium]|nr:alpha/beta hydrolase [Rhodocyclaceae bacterium]
MLKLFHSNAPSWPRRAARIAIRLLALIVAIGVGAPIGLRIAAHTCERLADGERLPSGGRLIASGDVKLFMQESGPADGMPIVFIPGTGAWSETWRTTLDALAAKGYHGIALDLPPFGYSQRPADHDYSTPRQAQRILGLLDALGIHEAVLVGHSFGSRATMQLALSAPQRVRAVALVDAALAVDTAPHADARSPWLLRWSPLRDTLIASTATNPLLTHFFLEQFTTRHEVLTPARVGLYSQPFARQGTTEAFGRWAMQFGEPTSGLLSADPAAYRKADIPALLIWGERDTVTPLAQGRHLATLLPRADLQILPDAGHIPQIETPAAFNATLLAFLGKL